MNKFGNLVDIDTAEVAVHLSNVEGKSGGRGKVCAWKLEGERESRFYATHFKFGTKIDT
jgi:hypothetical protein